jgi:exodeoxyribonuclease VII large subunit
VPDREEYISKISALDQRMTAKLYSRINDMRVYVDSLASRGVMRSPLGSIERRRLEIDGKNQLLVGRMNAIKDNKRSSVLALASGLNAMSPLNVLDRGYVYATDGDGRSVQSVSDINAGEDVTLRFSDGLATARIKNTLQFDGDK